MPAASRPSAERSFRPGQHTKSVLSAWLDLERLTSQQKHIVLDGQSLNVSAVVAAAWYV